eukprot:4451561-Ditylum_brightwellii.AAC.1
MVSVAVSGALALAVVMWSLFLDMAGESVTLKDAAWLITIVQNNHGGGSNKWCYSSFDCKNGIADADATVAGFSDNKMKEEEN